MQFISSTLFLILKVFDFKKKRKEGAIILTLYKTFLLFLLLFFLTFLFFLLPTSLRAYFLLSFIRCCLLPPLRFISLCVCHCHFALQTVLLVSIFETLPFQNVINVVLFILMFYLSLSLSASSVTTDGVYT